MRSVKFKYHGDTDHNYMGRYDPHGRIKLSVLTYHDELVEVQGKVNTKSLYTGSVLKCRVW